MWQTDGNIFANQASDDFEMCQGSIPHMEIKVSLHHLKTVEPPLSLELVLPSSLIIYIYFFTTKVGQTNCSDTWEISSQSYSITSVVWAYQSNTNSWGYYIFICWLYFFNVIQTFRNISDHASLWPNQVFQVQLQIPKMSQWMSQIALLFLYYCKSQVEITV